MSSDTTLRTKTPQRVALAVMAIAFLVVLTWALYTFLTSKYPGANDFYQRWRGIYAFWVEHRSPYDPAVSAQIELTLYGHRVTAGSSVNEYPGAFLYPFYTAIVLAPLGFVPYSVAEAIWLALTTLAVGVSFIMCADLFRWRPAPWLLMLGVIWAIIFYPSARGILLGQPGTMVACLEIATIWALVKKYDVVAGVALGLSLIKPQIGLLLIPFLMLWALRFGRWRFIISFGVCGALLGGASFLLDPHWISEMLQQVNQYNGYTQIGSPIWVITNYLLPFLGDPANTAITVILLLVMLWSWIPVLWRKDSSQFLWAAALTLTITHLVLVRTATTHFVVFFLVIVFYLRQLDRAGKRWAILAVMAVLGIGLWWLFLATLVDKFEGPLNYLPLPWGALILLVLTRKQWWSTSA